jgi:multiple sugar transport system substrate-binding protein/sn-glycerol 3-phosphate transport system substrate-binding protein
MRNKGLLMFVVALLAALSVGAVSAQDAVDWENVDPSGQHVVYWHQFSDAQGAAMQQIIDQFNSTNEWGIVVEPVHQGSYNDVRAQMSAAIISGEVPNLVAGYANDAASYFNDNSAADLRPFINSPKWGLTADEMADFNTGLLTANTLEGEPYNGAVLAWPHQNSEYTLVVNNAMLQQLGYDAPPQTFEEFKDIACKAAELTGPNGEDIQGFPIAAGPDSFDASLFEALVAGQGGNIYHDGAYDFTSDAVINTLQLFHDLYAEGCGYIPAAQYANTADFALGLNPMATTSSAGFTFIISDIAESGSGVDWSVATLPYADDNHTLEVFVPSIVLVPSTPEAELASWLFLKYLASPEAATIWASQTAYFTPVRSVASSLTADAFANKDLFPYWQAAAQLGADPDIHVYASPSIPSYGAVRGLISEALAAVTTGGGDVQEAAQTLQEGADEALADSA